MAIVAIENLSKVYQLGSLELCVLRDLDLSVEQGEYVAIMGPSGSGKSTLLNLIGCLDRPTSGSYFLGGQNVSQLEDTQLSLIRGARIGFVFQSFNLIPWMTVTQNIAIPLFYRGIPRRKRRHQSAELAEMVGLGERRDHRPFELSGGQMQRVAIARALSNDPLVLLADEPTGNLDTQTGEEIMEVFAELGARGKTIIMVTHESHIAQHAERIINLRDGRIQSDVMNDKKE